MSDSKTSSRSGSRTNLNESSLPLLESREEQSLADDKGHTPEKECIELTHDEKDDSSPEKTGDDKADQKEKKKRKKCAASCLPQTLPGELDLSQSDVQGISDFVNVDFSHVLAEPTSTHTFDPFWNVSGATFRGAHRWTYRLLAAPLALPLALVWGVVFALISLVSVWVVAPVMRIVQLVLCVVKQLVEGLSRAIVEPLATAAGTVFSNVRITQRTPHSV